MLPEGKRLFSCVFAKMLLELFNCKCFVRIGWNGEVSCVI